MNKTDLIASVASNAGLTKVQAEKAVNAVFDSISGALSKGQDVRAPGFGTFSVATRSARQGRNPRTGEPITIRAAKLPKFKAGKNLKEAVS